MQTHHQALGHGIGSPSRLIRLVGLLALAAHLTGCGPAVETTSSAAPESTGDGTSTKAPTAPAPPVTPTPPSPPSSDSATLSWSAPTQNTDGTPVTDLAGYYVHYGTSPSALSESLDVSGPASTTYVVTGLSSGTYYFAVSAYNSLGFEGALSNIASKTL